MWDFVEIENLRKMIGFVAGIHGKIMNWPDMPERHRGGKEIALRDLVRSR